MQQCAADALAPSCGSDELHLKIAVEYPRKTHRLRVSFSYQECHRRKIRGGKLAFNVSEIFLAQEVVGRSGQQAPTRRRRDDGRGQRPD